MYFNENWSAEICPLNRGNLLNRGPLNRGFTVCQGPENTHAQLLLQAKCKQKQRQKCSIFLLTRSRATFHSKIIVTISGSFDIMKNQYKMGSHFPYLIPAPLIFQKLPPFQKCLSKH